MSKAHSPSAHTHRATDEPVAATPRRISSAQRDELISLAVRRDGRGCWLCGGPFKPSGPLRVTLEHLTPRSHGGTDHHDNIFLAHQSCNVLLGDMTKREKIRFRRSLRGALRPSPLPAWHKRHKPTTPATPTLGGDGDAQASECANQSKADEGAG